MAPSEAPATTGPPSGVPEVEAALDALQVLDELPVHEHVAVFEQVHEALRHALDGARGPVGEPAAAAEQ